MSKNVTCATIREVLAWADAHSALDDLRAAIEGMQGGMSADDAAQEVWDLVTTDTQD